MLASSPPRLSQGVQLIYPRVSLTFTPWRLFDNLDT